MLSIIRSQTDACQAPLGVHRNSGIRREVEEGLERVRTFAPEIVGDNPAVRLHMEDPPAMNHRTG